MSNINLNWSQRISDTFYALGVKHICICPGARNTPLTLSFIKNKKFISTSHIDERSAAFFALGLSKKTGSPSIIITTSGTAVANLYPAIIESNYSKTPLIALTADRPKHDIGIGSNQAIDQNNIFNNNVKEFIDLGLPNEDLHLLQNKIINIFNSCIGTFDSPPGAIHINTPFDEPLIEDVDNIQKIYIKKIKSKLNYKYSPDLRNTSIDNSLIICGEINANESLDQILDFSEYVDAPILVDPTSNLRFYKKHKNIISNYNFFIDKIEKSPNIIFRFGRKPTSKVLLNFLKNHKNVYLIDRYPDFNDSANHKIKSDYESFLNYIKSSYEKINNNPFSTLFNKYQDKISNLINLSSKDFTEGIFIHKLLSQIPSNSNILLGNSLAIREVDDICLNINKNHNIFCNRGASGIDGLVSTMLGISYASKITSNIDLAILGDLSFFHDMNGLHFLINNKINTKFLILNNNGGQIFSKLDISKFDIPNFEKFWITPLNIDLKNIAQLYGVDYFEPKDLDDLLLMINKKNDRPLIIDYKIDIKISEERKEKLVESINKIIN
ncbi:MAG: 2-succinyl-5-enolpyruvyl-6-hydroxy-3-cyclohexene-1-carboxylic-acid synthase [Candidatus Marinimicrobia bacterium]|nr:2-succinyl-5-enolpyruvyl-6-hydroxy-3-cyclohexene-1-carboxylic-acid synthase [Candidatus Neomarinimicrobiota bacterium]|tara:strand:- start:1321 stop:2982 length:1662 start_codon:yes stop_codon:yes gene_type:complete